MFKYTRCLTYVIIGRMQIKLQLELHFLPNGLVKILNLEIYTEEP